MVDGPDHDVVIAGAGVAGLTLGCLLQQAGVSTVILERLDRAGMATRVRSGLWEHGAVELLREHGLADGLLASARACGSCDFRLGTDGPLTFPYGALTGRSHWVYPQQMLVEDLLTRYESLGGEVRFGTRVTGVHDLVWRPTMAYVDADGRPGSVSGSLAAGCDGWRGAVRAAVPCEVREYPHPWSWLTMLTATAPVAEHTVYAVHSDGFAGHMLRSGASSRYYLQVPAGSGASAWPEERVWSALRTRLGLNVAPGPVVERGALDMRSAVVSSMRFGRLFLAGDAAHIVPPCAGKGANLAVRDAVALAAGVVGWLRDGSWAGLAGYSADRLRSVHRTVEFTSWFLRALHTSRGPAVLTRALASPDAARMLADRYVG